MAKVFPDCLALAERVRTGRLASIYIKALHLPDKNDHRYDNLLELFNTVSQNKWEVVVGWDHITYKQNWLVLHDLRKSDGTTATAAFLRECLPSTVSFGPFLFSVSFFFSRQEVK